MIKSRIILNGKDLDLIEDVAMPLNYAIADVRNPEKKNTNFSKTITLPSTARNNELFGYLFDTNVTVNSSGTTNYSPSFNPNKKAEVLIYWEGNQIFTGYLKLDRIKVTEQYLIQYDVTVYGKLKDLFLALGERTLSDLDLTRYNHPYTAPVQAASWNNYIHKDGTTTAFNKGDGYVYPLVDYAMNNDVDYKVEHLFPALYYKTIIREIINQAGFQFDGTVFDNNDFKSLVVAYGGGSVKLTQTQISNRTFRASATTTQSVYSSGTTSTNTIVWNNDTTTPNNDVGNVYNTSTGVFTAAVNGTYKIIVNCSVNCTHRPSTASPTLYQKQLGWMIAWRTSGGSTTQAASLPIYISPTGGVVVNNAVTVFDSSPITSGATTSTYVGQLIAIVQLNAGDTITCKWNDLYIPQTQINCYGQLASSSSYVKVNFTTDSYFNVQLYDTSVKEGDTVDLSGLLPSNIKQREFLSSFFKMFNIYTEDDRYSPSLMHFETRPDFYATSGTTRDWSKKLDISKQYTIVPMGDLDANSYLYKFKDDGDYWNDYYKKKYNETYGQYRYDVQNDWVNSQNVTESIFSPTPLVDKAGNDRIIPRIFQINNNGQQVPKPSNLRLWYYGGLKSTVTGWNHVASSGTTQYSTFPYAGHLDDVSNPTYDVNFYQPIEVFYTATTYTANNLFNKYHRQFIDEITNKDSKILQGYFHLTAYDISILNFRDSFFILNDFWRLNKIVDYNPKEEGVPTLCEFIKLKGGVPFVATSGTTNGGRNISLGNYGNAPTYNQRSAASQFGYGQVVSGNFNVIDPSANGIMVGGNYNSVGANCNNISIVNSSGCTVMAGVQNVSVVNSNDMTIDARYNGQTVINNTIYGAQRILRKTVSYKGTANDLNAFVLFDISANATYDLPEPSSIFNGWTVLIKCKNNSGYAVTVNALSDATQSTLFEDGVSTTDVISPNDAYYYTYRNGVWLIT